LYVASAEDQKSIMMLETIVANGTTIPPIIIIQGQMHMEN